MPGTRSTLGAAVRGARLERDWTQRELADRAGISRALVSAIEVGAREASLESLERVARELDARLVVELRAPLAAGRLDQRDIAHARCVAAIRRALEGNGYVVAVEVPFVDGRARGWIDVVAFDPVACHLLVVEVKTQLRDVGGLQRQVRWYTANARAAVRPLGWRVREVSCLVVFLATDENDTALWANADAIRATFPVRGRALTDRLQARSGLGGWGIAMVDPRRRGARIWTRLALDGRRTPAPYRSHAAFARAIGLRADVAADRRRASRRSANGAGTT